LYPARTRKGKGEGRKGKKTGNLR
jgi:hypothetical protein